MFDAAKTSPLEFSFRPHVDVAGTIPDPSEARVRAFNLAVDKLRREAADETTKLLAEQDGDEQTQPDDPGLAEKATAIAERLHEKELDLVAELCAGTPTREQIADLPHRVRVAFMEWLGEELRNPTTLPATRPPLTAVR